MIVGAQRSGTTWVQLLCAANPKIVGGEELHLFSRYLGHLVAAYYQDKRAYADAGRAQGLPCLVTTEEFDAAVKQFTTTVLSKLFRCKPRAHMAVEKTPDHVLHLHYVRHLFPNVKVIHVIRDPRDVVVSQLAAAATWGEEWAAKTPAEAAERWVEWVSIGRKDASSGKYLEVRYESLLTDGPRVLAGIYDFLGYPLPAEQVERIYGQFTIASIKAGTAPDVLVNCREAPPPKPAAAPAAAPAPAPATNNAAAAPASLSSVTQAPEGFYRKGKAGGWRESLSADDVAAVERIAGPLMHELGYAPAAAAAAPAATPPTAAIVTG
jgi:hypothetical protein